MTRGARFARLALLLSLGCAPLVVAACGQDFDAFVVEGDVLPDGATATRADSGVTTTDGGAKTDGAVVIRDAASDAPAVDCTTKAACFSTKSTCADACDKTQSDCIDACSGGNNGCKNKCRADGTQCKSTCTSTCQTCATAACAAACN